MQAISSQSRSTVPSSRELMQLGISQSHVNSRCTAPEQPVEYEPMSPKMVKRIFTKFDNFINFANFDDSQKPKVTNNSRTTA